jgi:hypothetical protein
MHRVGKLHGLYCAACLEHASHSTYPTRRTGKASRTTRSSCLNCHDRAFLCQSAFSGRCVSMKRLPLPVQGWANHKTVFSLNVENQGTLPCLFIPPYFRSHRRVLPGREVFQSVSQLNSTTLQSLYPQSTERVIIFLRDGELFVGSCRQTMSQAASGSFVYKYLRSSP